MKIPALSHTFGLRFFKRAYRDLRDAFSPVKETTEPSLGKRILIFNWRDSKHAFAGGAEVYVHELAKKWVAEGNHVTVFSGSDGRSKRNELLDGVHIVRRGGFYVVYIWAALYYLTRFRKHTDIIIDCENGIPFFTPLYARKKTFLVIHHVHQEIFRKNLKQPFASFASFLEGKVMPLVYRNVQVITVSESSKQEIIDHALTRREPLIVHNGIDQDLFKPGSKSVTPLVLYIGRLQSYKSLDVFLKAAKQILTTLPQTQFVIAGNGEAKRDLHKLTKELGIQDHVRFTGYVSDEEKLSLLQQAWVFVNPSLREGWGITTIEANACKTPVIASRVPGLRDSIKDKETGVLVPYGDVTQFTDAITSLLTDETLRLTYGERAYAWSKNFSWDTSALQFSGIMAQEETYSSEEVRTGRFAYLVNKLYSFLF